MTDDIKPDPKILNTLGYCILLSAIAVCLTLIWLHYHPIHFDFTPEARSMLEQCVKTCNIGTVEAIK